MSRFRTAIPISKFPFQIKHDSKILSLGSCFSQEIGEKLNRSGFETLVNPFGIVFNPISLAQSLERLISGQAYGPSELILNQGKYHSLDHHGRFSAAEAETALGLINDEFQEASKELKNANVLCLTLGSAWAYRHVESGRVVANCHKIPQKEFDKVLVKNDEIIDRLGRVISSLSDNYESLDVVLTVSPVRHWKDGPLENQVSKSHLRIACDELSLKFYNCHYFPSYELVLDELRDYRFYADDMLHPSSAAVDFIWEKFQEVSMVAEVRQRASEFDKLHKALDHTGEGPQVEAAREEVRMKIHELKNQRN